MTFTGRVIFILIAVSLSGCETSTPTKASSQANAYDLRQGALESVIDKVSAAVVVIETDNRQGSGVLLSSDGVIATNLHVLEGAQDISVRLKSGGTFSEVSVIDYDAKRDLAILKVAGRGLPHAPLGKSLNVRSGKSIFVIGAPSGLEQTVSRGIVSAVRIEDPSYELIQTDAAISPGSSGGGLFDDDGNLIGVMVAYRTDGQNLNFAIPVSYVQPMLGQPVAYTESEFLALNATTEETPRTMTAAAPREKVEAWIKELSIDYSVEYALDDESDRFIVVLGDKMVFLLENYDELLLMWSPIVGDSDYTNEERDTIEDMSISANYSYFGIQASGLSLYSELPLIGTEFEAFEQVVIGAVGALVEINEVDFIKRRVEAEERAEAAAENAQTSAARGLASQSNESAASLYTARLPEIARSASTANLRMFTADSHSWNMYFDGFTWKESSEEGDPSLLYLKRRTGDAVAKIYFEPIDGIVDPNLALPMILEEYLLSLNATPGMSDLKVIGRGMRMVQGQVAAWARYTAVIEGFEVAYQTTVLSREKTLVTMHAGIGGTSDITWTKTEEITEEMLGNLRRS